MAKDFDAWNRRKKYLDRRQRVPHAYTREIWWCSLGVNIGTETDGKHDNFERPVLILKVYNRHSQLVLPLTSQKKAGVSQTKLQLAGKEQYAMLTQARVVSTKRLLRKMGELPVQEFDRIRSVWLKQI